MNFNTMPYEFTDLKDQSESLKIKVYEFDDPIDRAEALKILKSLTQTSGTELISYYCKNNLDSARISKLKSEQAQARSIKSKKTQKNVVNALDTLIEALARIETPKEDPFVIFVKDKFSLSMRLPSSLARTSYYCGKSFYIEPLESYSELQWGVLVLDTQQVCIGLYRNGALQTLQNYDVFIPGKMKAGGQSSVRFEQTRKNLVYSFIDQVSERCNAIFSENKISKLLLGGIIPTTQLFYGLNKLTPELKKILEEPVSTNYTNRKGLEEVILKKKDLYEAQLADYFEQKKLYQQALLNRANLYTLEELLHLENYNLVKVYTTDSGVAGLKYCSTCLKISPYCNHDKTPLKNHCQIKFFKNTEWGLKFNKLYRTLFEINPSPN